MNSVTLRLIAITGVLILEAILIVLNIPELSLVAGIILLGMILFMIGRMVSVRNSTVQKTPRRKKARDQRPAAMQPESAGTDEAPVQRSAEGGIKTTTQTSTRRPTDSLSRPGMFAAVGKRLKKLSFSSRSRSPQEPGIPGTMSGRDASVPDRKSVAVTTAGRPDALQEGEKRAVPHEDISAGLSSKPRFETFRTMKKGLKLLFTSRSRGLKTTGSEAVEMTPHNAEPGVTPPATSLASINVETVSPVGRKREPSPFSPLEKDMVLDADLVLSRQEKGKEASSDILNSGVDFDAPEIFAPESDIAHLDLSLDDERAITIDDEEDDEVAQILETHQDDLVTPVPGGEDFSIDRELDELGQFDLDMDDVVPDEELGEEPASRDAVQPPKASFQPDSAKEGVAPAKPAPKRSSTDEGMLAFSSGPSGDDDLLSSLRSDMISKKHQIDQSLVRDLKDVRVHIGEIEKDITELLTLYKKFE